MAGAGLALAAAGFWAGIVLAGARVDPGGPGLQAGPSPLWLLGGGMAVLLALAGLLATAARSRPPPAARVKGRGPSRWQDAAHGAGAAAAAVAVLAAFAMLGAGWAALHDGQVRRSPSAALVGRAVRLWAAVEADPEQRPFGWSAPARVEVLFPGVPGWPPAVRSPDRLWLRGTGARPAVRPGDRVEVSGVLSQLGDQAGAALRRRGFAASLTVRQVRVLGPSRSPVVRAAGAVRSTLRRSLGRVLPAREAGLVMALALGDTSRLAPEVEADFRATGLSHLVAVSGANVAMVLAPLLALGALVGLGSRARVVVGMAGVGFFVVLTGGQPSVLRAGAMAILVLFGVFLGRPRSPPAILGASVLGLLALDPTLAHAIGFQLSVAATAGMVLLAGPLAGRLGFLPAPVALAAGATLGAQAGVTPLLLFHFGVVPTVTLPANLLAFPAVAPAMLLGLGAGLGGLAWEPLGWAVGVGARLPLGYLVGLSDRLARSPLPSITSPGGQVAALALGLAAVAGAAWWLRSRRPLPRRAVLLAFLVAPAVVWSGALRAGPPASLTAVFFDVGQGDAALIRSPLGATVLIDGGPDPDLVARKLAALGIRRIDLMVASHAHADHVAGLPAVLGRFPVALVVDPGCAADSPFYDQFVEAVGRAGVPFRHPREGAVVRVADIRVEVLGPDRCFTGTESDPNNDSLVLRVTSGAASLLFPGDAEEPAQEELLRDRARSLRSVVLKVPHHGGDTSVSSFLQVVGASLAVVSVGPNTYGHPAPSVLRELQRSGARVVRTDRAGDVTVSFDGGRPLIESSGG